MCQLLKTSTCQTKEIIMRQFSTHFGHIFAGGYDLAHHAYMWSDILGSDGLILLLTQATGLIKRLHKDFTTLPLVQVIHLTIKMLKRSLEGEHQPQMHCWKTKALRNSVLLSF